MIQSNFIKFLFLFSIISVKLFSQQLPLNTQYIYNPIVINPAFSGISESSSIILMNRAQWKGFSEDEIATTSISADYILNNPKHGIGSMIYSDRTGAISLNGIDLMYSFKFPVFSDYNLSFGISTNLYQYVFDDNLFQTASYDPIISGEIHKKVNFDSNFGFLLYDDFLFFGGSIVNMIQSNVIDNYNNLSNPNQLIRNYYFFGGYNIFNKETKIGFEQSFLLKKTAFTDFQLDINIKTIFNDIFWLGAGYRNNNEIVGSLGFKYNRFSIVYSLDYNYGEIGSYSGPSHQFALIFYLKKGNNKDWKKDLNLIKDY